MEEYQVVPNAEEFFLKGNDTGILLSHGFLGTPQSLRFVGEALHKQGFTVYATRLKGHGTDPFDLKNASHWDWLNDVKRGFSFLKENCKQVFVLGQSMGGTLALRLALEEPDVAGIILVNAAMDIPDMACFKEQDKEIMVKEKEPDIKNKSAKEITYEETPTHAYHQLLEVMELVRHNVHQITCPVLCFQSTVDNVVPPENTDFLLSRIQSAIKKKIKLYHSYHVATLDNDKKMIAEEAGKFIKEQLSEQESDLSRINGQ
jgi:carboxylesterase